MFFSLTKEFNGDNLLRYSASCKEKYTTRLMEILFTQKELFEGYIIEGNSKSHRKQLDPERVSLLKSNNRSFLIARYSCILMGYILK